MNQTTVPVQERLGAYRKMFQLDGRTALVLGAASSIGKASAEVLAALGATVICADKDKDGVEATAAEIRLVGSAEAHVVDAGSSASINAFAAEIEEKHAQLDVAVTTPAIHIRKLMCDYADEEYDRVADLNMRGTFLFLRAFGRMMARQRRGSLIASSSVRATTLEPGLAIYGATKAAIIQMVRGLASEIGPLGVRVNAIVPSIVDTALVAPLRTQPEIWNALASHTVFSPWAEPREVAAAVAFLASDAASYITGTALIVDGGWTAIDGPPSGLTKTHSEGNPQAVRHSG
jgi:NAD(P)-dependent dehydrogenase (short-subunit alcohol dehydrogenase family)